MDYEGKQKARKLRRKFESLREKIKGAGSANGNDKMHEGRIKM